MGASSSSQRRNSTGSFQSHSTHTKSSIPATSFFGPPIFRMTTQACGSEWCEIAGSSPRRTWLCELAQESCPDFGFQFLNVWDTSKAIYGYGSGLRQNLDFSHFKRMPVAVPPPDEQTAIVRFLDWANGRLERAIRAKRKVIALLNEQKQAIIHRAVTRGLDQSPTLKPSGLPWLGDLPQSWQTRPLKQLLTRMDYGTSENARGEGTVRVLTMGHIRDGKVILPQTGVLKVAPPGLLLERNDLLFNRTNSADLVGKVGMSEGDAKDDVTFASYLVRLRVRSEHNPVWLNYLLNSTAFWGYARSHALVSLHQANLNSRRYGRMLLPVPSTRAEQDEIVQYVQIKAWEIERSVERHEREIELLREYRTRLVADVVTGKLDVREASARLPEEAAPDVTPEDAELIEETEPAEEEVV